MTDQTANNVSPAGNVTSYETSVKAVRAGASPEQEAAKLYDMLTDEERLGLLDGDEDFWPGQMAMMTEGYNVRPIPHGTIDRLGIPGYRFSDGPRGAVIGQSTAFPISMARGATFDPELEERIGEAIGAEVKAQGGNFFAGVCINLLRHPAWGRAQETYSDDPYVLGEMGAALVRGVRKYVMACAKHYALNSMENARFQVDVQCDERTLHEVYLPHFKRVVEEGVDAIMSSYNSVNGEWAGQNPELLTKILRDDWGFTGVTVSDFGFGLRDAAKSLEAGLDIEEPFRQQRAEHLPDDLAAGRASWEWVRRAGLRCLATQLRFDAEHHEPTPNLSVVASAGHCALAREAAARAMVLLKNDAVDGNPMLPLDPKTTGKVALIGRLANVANTGDHGSSNVRAPHVVTPYDGLTAAMGADNVITAFEDDPAVAAEAAGNADAAVIVVGYTYKDEGEFVDASSLSGLSFMYPPAPEGMDVEKLTAAGGDSLAYGGDRASLRLRPIDAEIIKAAAAANPKTIVVIVAAGAVITEEWRDAVPSVLLSWYSGMEGGTALADVLFGAAEPAGRLPFAVPTTEDDLPFFDRDATSITYDRLHGQRLLDKLGHAAAFPFGFGLSYTSFELNNVTALRQGLSHATLTVDVTNTGERDGRHVVQVFGVAADADHIPARTEAGERHLVGFKSVMVPAGETVQVTVDVSLEPISEWDTASKHFIAPSVVTLIAASHAGADDGLSVTL
ncbi:Glycosyl hydrolase family 3 N terminal domain-containing protein [Bifidobacterium margollesii]|uniref:Glycosyl hydrolase family 3 N terminal domain-containing protein n=1 Tax=Bifidobacterium margollesii TaxID=2020964 RepID=A0A2N5JCH1_9BIFI|nr:glycoside hydrolase family 3 C-terminal domain-containing protein [Bifidobacterium margollesii]PLS31905.1 Glycosyl hydrolase family 3 N terminal domain-containing protein [Bifidobacterium margollesii]